MVLSLSQIILNYIHILNSLRHQILYISYIVFGVIYIQPQNRLNSVIES